MDIDLRLEQSDRPQSRKLIVNELSVTDTNPLVEHEIRWHSC